MILAPCELPLFGEAVCRAWFFSREGGASVGGLGMFSHESRMLSVQNPKPVKKIENV
jgi:hypothetical protein